MSLSALQSHIQAQIDNNQEVLINENLLIKAGLQPDTTEIDDEQIDFNGMISRYLRTNQLIIKTTEVVPAPLDNKLTFSGMASFLNPDALTGADQNDESDKPATLVFSVDDDTPTNVHLTITSQPDEWTLQSSFNYLPDYPFQALSLLNNTIIFSSREVATYTCPWEEDKTVKLGVGLNYAAALKKEGPLDILSLIIKETSENLIFFGTVDPGVITSPDEASNAEEVILTPEISLSAKIGGQLNPFWPNINVAEPHVGIRTIEDEYGQSFWLTFFINLNFNDKTVTVETPIFEDWNQFGFGLLPSDTSNIPTVNDIATLAGGANFMDVVPDPLVSIFKNAGLLGMNASFNVDVLPTLSSISLIIGNANPDPWYLTDQFTINDIVLSFFLFNPGSDSNGLPASVSFSATMAFYTDIFPGDFIMDIGYEVADKVLSISGKYTDEPEGEVALTDILNGMSRGLSTSITLPSGFPDVSFSDFGVSFSKTGSSWDSYEFYGSAKVGFDITLLDKKLDSNFSLLVNKTEEGKSFLLDGGIVIGNAYFDFNINLSSEEKTMEATWYNQGNPLGLNDLAHSLGFEDFSIPEELDLGLKSAHFSYNFSEKEFVLIADSENWGTVSLSSVTDEATEKKALIFFCRLKGEIGTDEIKKIPVVGDELAGHFNFSQLKFLIATADFESITVPVLEYDEEGNPTLVNEDLADLKRGVTFMSDLTMGSHTETLIVPIYNPKPKSKTEQSLVISNEEQPAEMGGSTKVGRALGPFSFSEFGISLKDGNITFQLDASLVAAGLNLHLDGFNIGFSPSDLTDVSVGLEGLDVQFQGGAVSLAGGLLHNEENNSWDGVLAIAIGKAMITAIGSYKRTMTETENYTSLSVYGVIEYPLGGPPFFFITGGAVGFGYNTALQVPTINELHEFPLIQAVVGDDPPSNLNDAVEPSQGQNWFGLGVKFTSFKLIDGFALTSLSFGNQTETHFMGLASAQVPFTGKKPIAFIEMALLASFLPEEGILKFEGALTNRSFMLSQESQLTGGFAFYMWYGGDYAGDFVLTAGGYKNGYQIPQHYPTPTRIGLNWQISDHLSMVGENYFALTPSLIMAGGRVSCIWEKGKLKAWFNMGYDFLIAWQPFYYEATVYAQVGIKWKWFKKSVGVQVDIWGPDFSGKIYIDTWFKTFTISFGHKSGNALPPIDWTQFKQACFPPVDQSKSETESDVVLSLQVSKGLIKEGRTGSDVNWIINPADFALELGSLIPIKEYTFQKKETKHKSKNVGVGMVQIPSGTFTSSFTVSILQGRIDKSDLFDLEELTESVPASMWKCEPSKLNDADLIDDALTGFILTPKKEGDQPYQTDQIPMENLLFSPEIKQVALQFVDASVVPSSDSFNQSEALDTIYQTIDRSEVNDKRSAILSDLTDMGFKLNTTLNLPTAEDWTETTWLSTPTLSKLGEIKTDNS